MAASANEVLTAVQCGKEERGTSMSFSKAVRHLVASRQYEPALRRLEICRIQQDLSLVLDGAFGIATIIGLSQKDSEKLLVWQPLNLGIASEISGVFVAQISLVSPFVRRVRT